MTERRKRTSRGRSNDNTIRTIRLAAVLIIIVLVAAAVFFLMNRRSGREVNATAQGQTEDTEQLEFEIHGDSLEGSEGVAQEETTEAHVDPDNSEYNMDFSEYELKKDAIPQVNQLISQYFQAKVDQDAQALFKLFGKAPDDTSLEQRQEELKAEAVYIEDYQNITCYTKPGLTQDAYVAYVTYEVKFRRVDTLAPGLMWCYIVKADDGSYIIRENVVGDEADYVAGQNQTEDVRLLSSQVNDSLRQAIQSDILLAGIYSDLRNGAVVVASEEDTGEDSAVELMDEVGPAFTEAPPESTEEETEPGISGGPGVTAADTEE